MKLHLSCLVIFLSTCFRSIDIHAQKLFQTTSISIPSDKTSSIAVKGYNGVFLVIKTHSELYIYSYDTSFQINFHITKDINEKSNNTELIGAVQTGNTLAVLLSDKKQKTFTTMLVDLNSHQVLPSYSFKLDNLCYLNYFERDGKLNILTIKDNSSLFSVITFDSSGHQASMHYDLSTEKFNGDKVILFSYLLEDEDQSMYTHKHRLDRINPGEYVGDITSRYYGKMYTSGDELFITLNWHIAAPRTQVIRLNLKHETYKYYNVPYSTSAANEFRISQVCSFLLGHKLYTAITNDKSLEVGVYDLDSNRYLRHWGPDERSLDSLISSPYLDENLKRGKIDTIQSLKKFLAKAMDLSISANQNGNGGIDIYIGETLNNSGGGGGMMMMGAPGMGSAMAPIMFSIPGGPFTKHATPDVIKHRFFWCTIDSATYLKSSSSARMAAYRKYEEKYYELLDLNEEDDITTVNYGSVFYLGSYFPDQSLYIFRRYE